MKKVFIASDSYKESLSSLAVGQAIKAGLASNQKLSCEVSTLADGGEGTMELLTESLNGVVIKTRTHDPLGRLINTSFGLSKESKTAIIDVATSSGIELLTDLEKNPMKVSSYGTGELINKALGYNVNTIILGLGSSATVDLGFGMLSALGVEFLDADNQSVEVTGQSLSQIVDISIANINPKIYNTTFKIACDVDNVLTGSNGSCYTFAKQKGATPNQIENLESEFIRLNSLIEAKFKIDLNTVAGSGAAGGIGGSAYAFLGGQLMSGSDLIIELNGIEQKIKSCDIVITGEGRFDYQSLHGKGPMSIIKLAKKYHKQVIVICGSVDNQIYDSIAVEDVAIFSTITKVDSLENTLQAGYDNIKHTARAVSKLL